ncbi:GPR endopeptidase [Phosphitispora sp. TUW77]|uniref:GPR endopeptidase n=1 Tax=Phosphitispora sp. TUW77 TaxID=3152361 RepID=UPI003AB2749B
MGKGELYRSMGINIDMALEAHDIVRGDTGQEVPGVLMDKKNYENAEVSIIQIMDKSAEAMIGKPVGTYITIDAPEIRENNKQVHNKIAEILAEQLSFMLKIGPDDSVLLVGLGNWNSTPDALGPRVINYTLVTRHLKKYAPQDLSSQLRSVSALAPGVLGITGIETAEIIKGVVEKTQPNLIIAIDALAAQNTERIATSIQLADTGISPGSGIGNQRTGINIETMGVPVIAIGVPTVVNAAVIAQGTLDKFLQQIANNPSAMGQTASSFNPIVLQNIVTEVLGPYKTNLMVTPKEIDDLIEAIGKIISGGISIALHPSIDPEEFHMYLH